MSHVNKKNAKKLQWICWKEFHSHQIIIIKLIFQQEILLKLKSTWSMKNDSDLYLIWNIGITGQRVNVLVWFLSNDQHISEGDTSFFFPCDEF